MGEEGLRLAACVGLLRTGDFTWAHSFPHTQVHRGEETGSGRPALLRCQTEDDPDCND